MTTWARLRCERERKVPRSVFRTSVTNGVPDLPPFRAGRGRLQLYYIKQGVLCGGYACVTEPDTTVDVEVWASRATIEAMKTRYEWLRDVEDVV